jgi:IS30 family transposase
MVVKCYLSKFTVVRPLQNRKAVTVATELYKLYTEYGFVATLIHDNGSEFTAEVCNALADLLGIDERLCSPYHPQSNGLVENETKMG